jgi:hypothetical protein
MQIYDHKKVITGTAKQWFNPYMYTLVAPNQTQACPSSLPWDDPVLNACSFGYLGDAPHNSLDAMKKKYVGTMRYNGILGVGKMDGNTEELTDIHVRAAGFDVVAPYPWMGHHKEGKYAVDFKKDEDYIQAHSFKFGQTLYSVGYLPSPQWPALGWGGMSGIVLLQFVWSDEETAQNFADAFNRLLYAAYRNEDSAELQTFRAAAQAWRENPAKPPLSPEADRARILAENALKEKNLDSAIEHL